MSETEFITYYGRIDYPQLILRQLDRIASIRTRLSYPVNKIEVMNYLNAIKTLYMLSPPSVREEVGEPPNSSLGDLDNYLVRLRDALERRGLIGGRLIEVGRPDVDVHEEDS